MRRLLIVPGLVLLIAAVAPAVAAAKLPKPKTTLIVPGKSIAGVSLNMSEAKAKSAWGSGAKCTKVPGVGTTPAQDSCDWRGGPAGTDANAHITFLGGKVYFVGISTARTPMTSKPTGKQFASWKTAKGIGIGSKIGAVGKAYPAAKRNTSEGGAGWDIIQPKAITSFGGTKTVESISIRLPSA